jgi:UDP-glucuronate decarboxylase
MFFSKEKKFYPSKTKNILITGGAGFLGSHLIDRLIDEANIICVDNLIEEGNVNNIKHLLQKPNFRFLKHDINQPLDLSQFPELKDFRLDIHGLQEIYHFACPTSAKHFGRLRINILYANSIGTINVLELARYYKAKFLFASSSVVYGPKMKTQAPFKESELGEVNFTDERACYDEGKRFSETAIINYRDVYRLDTKIARIFRTYGPREPLFDGQMVPDFVLQALNNKPLIIYGDQNFSTSLCFVDDMTNGLIKLMESEEKNPINLGHPQQNKLIDLAEKIIKMTGSKSLMEFRGALPFMRTLGLPDISLAREKLSWFPIVRLEEGLEKLIEYVKANRMLLQPFIQKYDQE